MTNKMIHILWAGQERKIIDGKNRVWIFEDHRYCGPVVIDRHGDPKDKQPPENSPFWDAVSLWYQQGKQIDKNGFCVWQKPTIQKMRHISGRYYELLP